MGTCGEYGYDDDYDDEAQADSEYEYEYDSSDNYPVDFFLGASLPDTRLAALINRDPSVKVLTHAVYHPNAGLETFIEAFRSGERGESILRHAFAEKAAISHEIRDYYYNDDFRWIFGYEAAINVVKYVKGSFYDCLFEDEWLKQEFLDCSMSLLFDREILNYLKICANVKMDISERTLSRGESIYSCFGVEPYIASAMAAELSSRRRPKKLLNAEDEKTLATLFDALTPNKFDHTVSYAQNALFRIVPYGSDTSYRMFEEALKPENIAFLNRIGMDPNLFSDERYSRAAMDAYIIPHAGEEAAEFGTPYALTWNQAFRSILEIRASDVKYQKELFHALLARTAVEQPVNWNGGSILLLPTLVRAGFTLATEGRDALLIDALKKQYSRSEEEVAPRISRALLLLIMTDSSIATEKLVDAVLASDNSDFSYLEALLLEGVMLSDSILRKHVVEKLPEYQKSEDFDVSENLLAAAQKAYGFSVEAKFRMFAAASTYTVNYLKEEHPNEYRDMFAEIVKYREIGDLPEYLQREILANGLE